MKYCVFVIDSVTGKILTSTVTNDSTISLEFRYSIRYHYKIVDTKIDKSEICHTVEYRVLT